MTITTMVNIIRIIAIRVIKIEGKRERLYIKTGSQGIIIITRQKQQKLEEWEPRFIGRATEKQLYSKNNNL